MRPASATEIIISRPDLTTATRLLLKAPRRAGWTEKEVQAVTSATKDERRQ